MLLPSPYFHWPCDKKISVKKKLTKSANSYSGAGACSGDSGGPFVCPNQVNMVLVAMVEKLMVVKVEKLEFMWQSLCLAQPGEHADGGDADGGNGGLVDDGIGGEVDGGDGDGGEVGVAMPLSAPTR